MKLINWEAISAISTCLGVIITAFLTYIIIRQTRKLNQNQTQLEERINEQQMSMQKRQIKVDIFPYKRELYLNIYKVLEFSNAISELLLKLNLKERTLKDIFAIYEVIKNQHLGDNQVIAQSLREAEYILPRNISPTIEELNKAFDSICSRLMSCKVLGEFLTKPEMEYQKEFILKEVQSLSNIINSKVNFLLSIMPNELNISDLDR